MQKKTFVLASVLAAVAASPASAAASTLRGVLVAKDPHRQTVVLASANGQARTIYVGSAGKRLALGRQVAFTARPLGNGRFVGRSARVFKRTKSARLRAVVLRDDRRRGSYLVSAGGSTFVLRARPSARDLASSSETPPPALPPGTPIVATVTPTASGPQATSLTQTGQQEASVQLNGIFLGAAGDKLQIAVVGKGLVSLTVPAGFVVPALSPGQLVAATATPGATGELTLTAIRPDNPPPAAEDRKSINITITIVNSNTNSTSNSNRSRDDDDESEDDDDDESEDDDDDD